jgi:hypothetical protein
MIKCKKDLRNRPIVSSNIKFIEYMIDCIAALE